MSFSRSVSKSAGDGGSNQPRRTLARIVRSWQLRTKHASSCSRNQAGRSSGLMKAALRSMLEVRRSVKSSTISSEARNMRSHTALVARAMTPSASVIMRHSALWPSSSRWNVFDFLSSCEMAMPRASVSCAVRRLLLFWRVVDCVEC